MTKKRNSIKMMNRMITTLLVVVLVLLKQIFLWAITSFSLVSDFPVDQIATKPERSLDAQSALILSLCEKWKRNQVWERENQFQFPIDFSSLCEIFAFVSAQRIVYVYLITVCMNFLRQHAVVYVYLYGYNSCAAIMGARKSVLGTIPLC